LNPFLNQAVCDVSEGEVMRMNSVRLVRRLALVDRKWTREHSGGGGGDDDDNSAAFDMGALRTLQRQFGDFLAQGRGGDGRGLTRGRVRKFGRRDCVVC